MKNNYNRISGETPGICGRDIAAEDLLSRPPVEFHEEKTDAYYRDKVILITGGGGSIGSELCRQIAEMQPKRLILLDVYENGAYDIQQELRIAVPTFCAPADVNREIRQ